jgi:hypothetical protein
MTTVLKLEVSKNICEVYKDPVCLFVIVWPAGSGRKEGSVGIVLCEIKEDSPYTYPERPVLKVRRDTVKGLVKVTPYNHLAYSQGSARENNFILESEVADLLNAGIRVRITIYMDSALFDRMLVNSSEAGFLELVEGMASQGDR